MKRTESAAQVRAMLASAIAALPDIYRACS